MVLRTENGWYQVGPDQLDRSPIPGTGVIIALQKGIPSVILKAFAADLNQFVESVNNARGGTDEGGWTPTNSVATSNHLSGTAFDYNWSDHPMGYADAGWNGSTIIAGDQVPAVRELLDWYEGMVFWGNDWTIPKDSMHFQMGYGTHDNQATCRDFIARKIRADGYSTYRRDSANTTTNDRAVAILWAAVQPSSVTRGRIAHLLPKLVASWKACECTTIERRAMWLAQVGHESGGLRYREEIASGAAYEGRADLGNTQPGDGERFKGRDFIEVTGRANYTKLSHWAYQHGMVSSPTFFVDNPAALAMDAYAFVGTSWYWTTQRPMNVAADQRDLELATRYVNGGHHGIDDRRTRYHHALAMGHQLLEITTEGEDDMFTDDDRNMLRQISGIHRQSLSPLRHLGEGEVNTCAGFAWTADGLTHPQFVHMAAKLGHHDSIKLLAEIAGADPVTYPDRQDDAKLAQAMLADIEATNPHILQGFIATQKGQP